MRACKVQEAVLQREEESKNLPYAWIYIYSFTGRNNQRNNHISLGFRNSFWQLSEVCFGLMWCWQILHFFDKKMQGNIYRGMIMILWKKHNNQTNQNGKNIFFLKIVKSFVFQCRKKKGSSCYRVSSVSFTAYLTPTAFSRTFLALWHQL